MFTKAPRTVTEMLEKMTPELWEVVAIARQQLSPADDPSEMCEWLRSMGLRNRERHLVQRLISSGYADLDSPQLASHWPERAASVGPDPTGHVCVYCGAPAEQREHVWPRARGGDDHPNNLVWACRRCNQSKGTRSIFPMRCPSCQFDRHPGDMNTATGTAYYSCRCGHSWSYRWNLQDPYRFPS